MSGALILLIITAILLVLAVTLILRRAIKENKRKTDPYDNFHLGEITRHDLPPNYSALNKEYTKVRQDFTRVSYSKRNEKRRKN